VSDEPLQPGQGIPELSPELLGTLFCTDPAVGFAICDLDGTVLVVNERSAEIFTGGTAAEAKGKTLDELLGPKWAGERLEMFRRIAETRKPIISRHILFGKQIQSTLRVITEPDAAKPLFSVVTSEGIHDPSDPDAFEVVESKLVHLGPLDALTRREIEVLALIGHGMTAKQIAATLHRSARTIEQHADSIRSKLKGATRVQLAHFASAACLELKDADLTRL
jgi:DNA-binding CsgD family transcriptional regulator